MKIGILVFTILFQIADAFARQSLLERCERVGGRLATHNRITQCICQGAIVNPDDPQAARFCLDGVVRLTSDSLESVRSVGSAKECGAHEVSFQTTNPNIRCPSNWLSTSLDNREDDFLNLMKSPSESCKEVLTERAGGGKNYVEVAHLLNQDPNTTLNASRDQWDQCFPLHVPFSETEKADAVSGYYYGMNRLKQAQIAAIRAIANADSYLEEDDDFWRDRNNCWDPHFPELVDICSRQRECARNKTSANQKIEAQLPFVGMYAELLHEKKLARNRICQTEIGLDVQCIEEKELRISEIDGLLSIFEVQYPVFKGKIFQKKLSDFPGINDDGYKDALKSQLQDNREQMKKRLIEFREATKCMNTVGGSRLDCEGKTVDKVLALTPELPDINVENYQSPEGRLQGNYINVSMSRASCMHKIRMNVRESDALATDVALDLVLTGATMGAASSLQTLTSLRSTMQARKMAQITHPVLKLVAGGAKVAQLPGKLMDTYHACSSTIEGKLGTDGEPTACLEAGIQGEQLTASTSFLSCALGVSKIGLKSAGILSLFNKPALSKMGDVLKNVEKYTFSLDKTLGQGAALHLTRNRERIKDVVKEAFRTDVIRKLAVATAQMLTTNDLDRHLNLSAQELQKALKDNNVDVSLSEAESIFLEVIGHEVRS